MEEIDLKISPQLKQWLVDAVDELGPRHGSILLMKDEACPRPEDGWAMSVATPETIDLCGINPSNLARVDGLVCIVTHPTLTHEVDGKYLNWDEEGMWLENRH